MATKKTQSTSAAGKKTPAGKKAAQAQEEAPAPDQALAEAGPGATTQAILHVPVQVLREGARLPQYHHQGDAGFDLAAARATRIAPGAVAQVPTGLAFAVPQGFELQVRPRGGASLKRPLRIANAPGTVDAGFRGEVFILAHNYSHEWQTVATGERIAQGVLAPVGMGVFEAVDALPALDSRGPGCLGSTDNQGDGQ